MSEALSAAQEAEAQLLAERVTDAAQEELLQIARTLVASSPGTLFGATEFKVRDVILRVAAKAYEEHLAQKKTATTAPASPARTAARRQPTTPIGSGGR
jgi:hypothetical protein